MFVQVTDLVLGNETSLLIRSFIESPHHINIARLIKRQGSRVTGSTAEVYFPDANM
jgi:hypothetical protein